MHWCIGALVHWGIGALGHWCIGAMGHWGNGALGHWGIRLHHEYVELPELEAVVGRVDEVGVLRQPQLPLHQVHHVRDQVVHAHQRAPPGEA